MTQPTNDTDRLLACLLGPRTPQPLASLSEWRLVDQAVAREFPNPIDRAIVGGLRADRVGYAFASGYQAALRRLVPDLPGEAVVSLCVTEEGGGHPSAIKTRLERVGDRWRLDGQKKWATLSNDGSFFLVTASVGADENGRNRLRIVRVPADRPGVSIKPMPPTPFAPEITHGMPRFEDVTVDEADLLPGDGYAEVVKPFRTIEDVHVTAAIVGYLVGVAADSGWPDAYREDLLAVAVGFRSIAGADARRAETHLALGGVLRAAGNLIEGSADHWSTAPAEARERWERDRPLRGVAGGARAKRLEVAWGRVRT